MDPRVVMQIVSCPFCGEPVELVVDLSAGSQSYVEDCEVCCRPMQVGLHVQAGGEWTIDVESAV